MSAAQPVAKEVVKAVVKAAPKVKQATTVIIAMINRDIFRLKG